MKQLSLLLSLIFLSFCSDKKHQPTASKVTGQDSSFAQQQTDKGKSQPEKLFIKDESRYSKAFVEELRRMNYPSPIQVIDNILVVEGDTIAFPNDLTINREYTFTGEVGHQIFSLFVTRINESSINYVQKVHKKQAVVYADSGQADLSAHFFLASEVDEDDITGTSYGSIEYRKKSYPCLYSIRIGIGSDDQKRLRAAVGYGCKGKTKKFIMPEVLTLRTKKNAL